MKTSAGLPLRAAVILIAGVGASAQTARGQQAPEIPKASQIDSASDLPKYLLEFAPANPIPGVIGSPMLATPIPCSPDGVPFVLMPLPPTYQNNLVESLERSGGHTFPYSTIPGLFDIFLLNYFPAGSEAVFLVTATKDSKVSQYSVKTPDGKVISGQSYSGVHGRFIVRFDRQGSYKSTVELSPGYDYLKLAELPDGNFLLLGYSTANKTASLQLVDSNGKPLRDLELPQEMKNSDDVQAAQAGDELDTARAAASISTWQFIPARQKVVLYRPGNAGPVLELAADGAIRKVPLSAPSGYILDAFVPAADGWLVRYRREGLATSKTVDASDASGNFEIYKVDPRDGSLVARLLTGKGSALQIVCEADGNLTSYSLGKNSQFLLASAPLAR
jgi:hypothetical protein